MLTIKESELSEETKQALCEFLNNLLKLYSLRLISSPSDMKVNQELVQLQSELDALNGVVENFVAKIKEYQQQNREITQEIQQTACQKDIIEYRNLLNNNAREITEHTKEKSLTENAIFEKKQQLKTKQKLKDFLQHMFFKISPRISIQVVSTDSENPLKPS